MNGPKLLKEKEKPKKKKTVSQLKKQLDALFSIFIRKRDCHQGDYGTCFTCEKPLHWKEGQCGHFVSRQYLATRYDPRNCRLQCKGCNVFGGGRTVIFAEKLEAEDPGIVTELYKLANTTYPNFPYEKYIKKYEVLNQGQ